MYKSGQWSAICDVCGFEFYSGELKKRWDGLMVCDKDFELDHPQKYLRVREDKISVPWVRSDPSETFIHACYVYAVPSYADLGEADCMKADNQSLTYQQAVNMKAGV